MTISNLLVGIVYYIDSHTWDEKVNYISYYSSISQNGSIGLYIIFPAIQREATEELENGEIWQREWDFVAFYRHKDFMNLSLEAWRKIPKRISIEGGLLPYVTS